MNIQSTLQNDIRSEKMSPGAYEWWYFDAISADGQTQLVIIFYEGNPFSRRYIDCQEGGDRALAEDFPAISISIYRRGQPAYYSFTEVKKENAHFCNEEPLAQVGNHEMRGEMKDDLLCYLLKLDEELPSGDQIKGELRFKAPVESDENVGLSIKNLDHSWNIVQPRADVSGRLSFSKANGTLVNIDFIGQGYHDHNTGLEPLKEQFEEWYWGRFHFPGATLIYYSMSPEQEAFGWLIDGNGRCTEVFNSIQKKDKSRTLYGLNSARKISLEGELTKVMIQQNKVLDNGPFYQRFSSDAIMTIPNKNCIEKIEGITEYLCPPRIYNKWHWPLTNMRIRYKKESPHWVQRSKRLYRWTW